MGFRSSKGVYIPFLIYGSAWKKDQTSFYVKHALKNGFRGIDTACQPKHYNEKQVGDAIADFAFHGIERSEIYLQTKFTPVAGHDPDNIPYDNGLSPMDQVFESFEVSKKNLSTDYVDTLILHSPISPLSDLVSVWKAMEEIVRRGEARQLGISNCYDLDLLKFLVENSDVKPAILQNRFYQNTGYDKELREYGKKQGIIYQSFWTLTANGHIINSFLLKDISKRYGKTEAQVFFRYLNQCGIVPLTGTTSELHMKEDLTILDFTLSEEECESISSILT